RGANEYSKGQARTSTRRSYLWRAILYRSGRSATYPGATQEATTNKALCARRPTVIFVPGRLNLLCDWLPGLPDLRRTLSQRSFSRSSRDTASAKGRGVFNNSVTETS